ncbi:MAG: hypothetical protein WAN93_02185 [Solirubrobacteraceae bacterium]
MRQLPAKETTMLRRCQAAERRQVPSFTGDVQIPFCFFDWSMLCLLDPLDDDGLLMEIATGNDIPRERRPYDPLTAWITMAYIGAIEEGGPILKPELNREQRLGLARQVLTDEELIVVETIAVPKCYRKLAARELEEMIRAAPEYIDRMWAGCWLELVGWTKSAKCSFGGMSNKFPMGEIQEAIIEAYAHSIGVTSREDCLGWMRIDNGYDANLISHRLNICWMHYRLNGPPPYELMRETVPVGPGWKKVMRIVPDKPQQARLQP